ncbi:MAG: hypothetical protein EBS19_02535, partial [Spirochaetia bacterium]|nr:hypothetical protein [Spirochaetia bacterium]
MFTLKSSQVFEKSKKSSVQVLPPVISSSFLLFSKFHSRNLSPVGDFPRRVNIGELLYQDSSNKVLSPINGLAFLNSQDNNISLRIDGELNFKPKYERKEFNINEIKSKLNELGVVSLDFNCEPFSKFVEEFAGSSESLIVFSPITAEGNYDYKSVILSKYKPEFDTFKKSMEKTFPNSKVLDFLVEKKVSYKYPDGLYNLFLKKYCNITQPKFISHKNILYIGPETLYYLLQALYYNSPFHERLVSVNILNKKGKFEGDAKYFTIKNGTNLSNFLQYFKDKYRYKFFTINSLYNKQPVLEIGEDFIYSIYNHSSFYICEAKNTSVNEGICIDCGDCNYYCPVNA